MVVSRKFAAAKKGQVSMKVAAAKNGQVSRKFAAAKNGKVCRKFAAAKIGQISRKFAAAKLFVADSFCFSLTVRAITFLCEQMTKHPTYGLSHLFTYKVSREFAAAKMVNLAENLLQPKWSI